MRRLAFGVVVVWGCIACTGKSGSLETAKSIQINEGGIQPGSGPSEQLGSGEVYQNQSLPQDFSLQMPVLTTSAGNNTIDLGRCYMDFAPGAINLDAHTRRLCGLQFTQVQLELRALFLDLALPDIRAFCKNQLAGCNLSGQDFTVTVSEPVMRRVQKLFEFYQYTGLEGYFQYNGYAISNGAKIPFRIDEYAETQVAPYDYRAVLRTRVIGTYAGEAQVRDNAGDVVIYWDKQRQNILMDFRTSVELFGFQINLRRTYDFSSRGTGVRYTSSVHYWQNGSTLVHGNAVVAEPCDSSAAVCTKVRHIASEFIGNDADLNGLSAGESYYDALRFSEGVVDANGGIVDSYLEAGGSKTKERLVFSGTTMVDFLISAAPGASFSNPTNSNHYLNLYATAGRLNLSMQAQLYEGVMPARAILYLAAQNAAEATQVRGQVLSGAAGNLVLRWGDAAPHQSVFTFGGAQNYQAIGSTAENLHPLY